MLVCVCVFKFFSEITRPLAKFHAEPPWKKVYSNDSGHLLFFILILSGTFSMDFQFLFIAFLLLLPQIWSRSAGLLVRL